MTSGNRRVGSAKFPSQADRESPRPSGALRLGTSAAAASPKAHLKASLPFLRVPERLLSSMRALGSVVLVTSASVGVALVARRYVLCSPRFALTSIEVTGNDRRSTATLIAESGLPLGRNVFALDLDQAHDQLLADANVESATLVRRLPGTVAIRVIERKVGGLVALGDLFLATPEGEPFKRLDEEDPTNLPIVTGLRAEDLADDHVGAKRSIQHAFELAAEYEQTDLAKRAPLQEVHVGQGRELTLVVGHTGVRLVVGGPPFRRKLEQAARVVAEVDRRGGRPDEVMVDNEARPERVVVRLR